MNDSFRIFEFIRTYIDNLFISTKRHWTDYCKKLELTLNKLKESGLKCDIENKFFG